MCSGCHRSRLCRRSRSLLWAVPAVSVCLYINAAIIIRIEFANLIKAQTQVYKPRNRSEPSTASRETGNEIPK